MVTPSFLIGFQQPLLRSAFPTFIFYFILFYLFLFCHTTDNNTKIKFKEQGKKKE